MRGISRSVSGHADAVYDKIAWRIIPFLALLFLVAWVDRYNLGFAKLHMVEDLGFSEAAYGFGAGIVYFGYALFEIPSNLILERFGARKTFARITILWGVTSMATAFVKNPIQFYTLRFLLGSFEAGLYPGVIVYLTYWFPARRRAQMVSLFGTSVPISTILGGPISGWIMGSMGGHAGLANWQWLFVLEGVPSILLGLLTILILVDKPAEAHWLTEGDKRLVLADLDADRRVAGPREHGFGEALKLGNLWLLTAIRFCGNAANVTVAFWIPSIIRELGVKNALGIGVVAAVPYLGALVGMVLVGRHSDRTLERRYHAALSYVASAVGLTGLSMSTHSPVLAVAFLTMAVAGPIISNGPFWQIPPMFLSGSAAAGGIALINSVGSLSGWVGSSVVGWLEDLTGTTATGLYVVAGLEFLGAVLMLFVPHTVAKEQHKPSVEEGVCQEHSQ
jgi:D-galactonate transporter